MGRAQDCRTRAPVWDLKVDVIPWPNIGDGRWAWRLAGDPVGGGLWLGFYSGGIAHWVDGRGVKAYGAQDGLGKGRVNQVRVIPDGTVLAATDGGLSRIKDGRIATLDSRNGLPCDSVLWNLDDADGARWLCMTCGLVRIARSDLDTWSAAIDSGRKPEPVPTTLFDQRDGVGTFDANTTFSPHATRSSDGKLWFVVEDGLMVVDPHHIAVNKLPPPVHVEQVTADRKMYGASSRLELPPLVRDLEIQYTALSLVVPEKVQFKYKLEGHDRDWHDAGNRRQAFYTDLDPGNYRFRVIAANNSGLWNEQGASLDFSIEPAYWQTNWFRALCVLAFIALLCGLYLLRMRQVRREFSLTLDTRVAERTRIARDLHDTLLQSFHGLLYRFQAVLMLLPGEPAKAREVLEGAVNQASQAITEGRDAVQGLRASATEMNDLAEAIRVLAGELAAEALDPAAVSVRIEVQGASRALHPIVRDEVFRIADEALRNAIRHANAKQIEVEIRYDAREFRLRVRDDGSGIDPAVLQAGGREGHFGLRGIRERAQAVGGKLRLWSALDTGTEVELIIPGSRAYASAPSVRPRLADKLFGQTISDD